jgi:hypothetical protein
MAQAHAFISYVRDNSDIVDHLAADLRRLGIEVWLDRNNIMPGQRWKAAIRKAIQQGAFFIACYSRELSARPETYMHGELRLAIDRLRNMPNDRTWFIPVFLNKTEIPSHEISDHETLRDLNTVALYEDWNAGLNAILRAMRLDDPVSARIHSLIGALHRPFHHERIFALEQLGSIGAAAADAVPALAEALTDQNEYVRQHAADALGRIGPAAADAVPALVEALKGANAVVRQHAADALRRVGPAAADAVPALAEALNDRIAYVRPRAAAALKGIGRAAVPALAEALKDQNTDVRQHAAGALTGIGPAAADAVPALTEALKDQDASVRQLAAEALEAVRQKS